MKILTERRRWWIAGSTLAICVFILIWGPKSRDKDAGHPPGGMKEEMTPASGDTRDVRDEKSVGQP